MNNPGFIIGDDGVIIMIDAGSTVQVGEMVVNIIRSISPLPIVATFSTHIHGDHWLGNQAIASAYPDADHYAHPKLIEQANAGEGIAWVSLMDNLTQGASAGTVFHAPTLTVDEGDQLKIAGKTITVFHDALAHTDTDIVLRYEEESVVFFGDSVFNGRLGRMDDGGFKGLIALLNRMLQQNILVYVPGHGKTGSVDIVIQYKTIIETIYNTVIEEYDNGLADYEIKPLVEAKIEHPALWLDMDASLGKFVSLAYLEVEADVF